MFTNGKLIVQNPTHIRSGKIVVFQSKKNKLWYFSVRASNGRKVAQSEGYTTKAKAIKTAENLFKMVRFAPVIADVK